MDEQKVQASFAKSYDIVRYNNKLSSGARLLFTEIVKLSSQQGYCWASNKRFSEIFDISKATVQRYITELKKQNLIVIDFEYQGNCKAVGKRKIVVKLPMPKNGDTPTSNLNIGGIKNEVGVVSNLNRGYTHFCDGGGIKNEADNKIKYNNINLNRLKESDISSEQAPNTLPLIVLPLKNGEYKITQEGFNKLCELFPNSDVMQALRNMKAWLLANPNKRKTAKGVMRFITGWLTREQNGQSNENFTALQQNAKELNRKKIMEDFFNEHERSL